MKSGLLLLLLAAPAALGQGVAPPPVTVQLPFFCGNNRTPYPTKPGPAVCASPVQASNGKDIAAAAAAQKPPASFQLKADDAGTSITITCNAQPTCPGDAQTFINKNAYPTFEYRLQGCVPGASLSTPPLAPCSNGIQVLLTNAAEVVNTVEKDPIISKKYNLASPLPSLILYTCKLAGSGCTDSDQNYLLELLKTTAMTGQNYTQNYPVPEGKAADAATTINASKPLGVTAEAIGRNTVRLTSKTRVSPDDVDAIMAFAFNPAAPPIFRMFYQDPTGVLKNLIPPPSSQTGGSGTPAAQSPSQSPSGSDKTASSGQQPCSSESSAASGSKASQGANSPCITVTLQTTSQTTTTPPPSTTKQQDGAGKGPSPDAVAAGAPGASGPTGATQGPTVTTTTTAAITPPASPSGSGSEKPPSQPAVVAGMTAVNDNVAFTDGANDSTVSQRIRLLTLLDLPRPEVLMNVWSYQTSSSSGTEILKRAEKVRDLVSAHNDALENSIQYGWSYLSAVIGISPPCAVGPCYSPSPAPAPDPAPAPAPVDPEFPSGPNAQELQRPPQELPPTGSLAPHPTQTGPEQIPQSQAAPGQVPPFFDRDFYTYVTQKFAFGMPTDEKDKRGYCSDNVYCLGFTHAFEPQKPNLTSILLTAMASKTPLNTILHTIGCMEGKYEVYTDCFPDRPYLTELIGKVKTAQSQEQKEVKQIQRESKRKKGGGERDRTALDVEQQTTWPANLSPSAPQAGSAPSIQELGRITVQQGAEIRVRLLHDVTSKDKAGDTFSATLIAPLSAQGIEIAPPGISAQGRIVSLQRQQQDRKKNQEKQLSLALELTSLTLAGGRQLYIQTDPLNHSAKGPVMFTPGEELMFRLAGAIVIPRKIAIPPGTVITVQPSSVLSSAYQQPGNLFTATLARDLLAGNLPVAKSGATVYGMVVRAQSGPPNVLAVGLTRLILADGAQLPLQTDVYAETSTSGAVVFDANRQLSFSLLNSVFVANSEYSSLNGPAPPPNPCGDRIQDPGAPQPPCQQLEEARACIASQRKRLLADKRYRDRVSCETLDDVALEAQETCGMAKTLPLSCFTIQAAQSFSSSTDFSFSTLTLKDLNNLAEINLADHVHENPNATYSATRIGLLRSAIADFLFNYKMAQEFPKDFLPYGLQHSAQELNAELNPLVVSFNQDVAAFSQHLSNHLDESSSGPLHASRSFISDGIITVRGIGGDQSSVDTVTQSYLDATQAKSLSDVLSSLTGQGQGGGSGASNSQSSTLLTALGKGTLDASTVLPLAAALTPPKTTAKIGRDLSFTVTPHTLPGASSAELEVTLLAADTPDSGVYSSNSSSAAVDMTSHVASSKVITRVRVESVKMFELSSFSALLQRPRSKFPLVPPFIELPLIGNFASVPLPGAKEYHRSTAIVSAVIVPTAADLAYGIDFVTDSDERNGQYKSLSYLLSRKAAPSGEGKAGEGKAPLSLADIRAFNRAMTDCLATNGRRVFPGGNLQATIFGSGSPAQAPQSNCLGALQLGVGQ